MEQPPDQSVPIDAADPVAAERQVKEAFAANDAGRVARLLDRFPQLAARINDASLAFGSPPIVCAAQRGRREMIDVLLRFGADVNARTDWWAGGFGVLDVADPELAPFLIERGARVDVHAAARLRMLDKLEALVADDPERVHARGGDGKTPLHCAATIDVARFLLDHGADIDARDVDHESTPAQYAAGSRQEVARYLIGRGCGTDVLLAAALGEADLVRRLLDADPQTVHVRVSDEWFPMVRPKGGGTIYQWELGWYVSAHQVARKRGHEAIFELLMDRTPPEEKLLVACWLHDEALVGRLLGADAGLAGRLPPAGRRHVAHAAHNNDAAALRLMLSAGLSADVRGRHAATPLHWAANHGNAQMTRMLLAHAPPLEAPDEDFKATPLGWAIHASREGWHRDAEEAVEVVRLLLDAGAKLPDKPDGAPGVREELRRRGIAD